MRTVLGWAFATPIGLGFVVQAVRGEQSSETIGGDNADD